MEYFELGDQLLEFRQAQRLSQQKLADAVGISRATINALETGRAGDVGIRKVIKILKFFNHELCIKQTTDFPVFEELR